MRPEITRDILCAVIFLAVGLSLHFVLIDVGIPVPASLTIPALSPDFWPRVVAIAISACAIVLLVQTLILARTVSKVTAATESEAQETDPTYKTHVGTLRVAGLLAAMCGFYFVLAYLGMVAASVILVSAMMLFFGETRLVLVAALSVAVPTCLYLFFRYIAGIPIPLGLFEG